MSRETTIQIRLSFEEKEAIQKRAKERGESPSAYMRMMSVAFVETKKEREEALARAAGYEGLPTVDLPPETPEQDREAWVAQKVAKHKLRMSTRAAEALGKREWDEHG
jgi:hypothetical protein